VFGAALATTVGVSVWNRASEPVNATNEWLDLVRDGDVVGAVPHTCDDSSTAELVSFIESYTGSPITEFEMTGGTSSGREATVEGTITGPSGQWDFTIYLVDSEGWKVCEVV
jgi:hypothetical protein